jgi:hypothetical protein
MMTLDGIVVSGRGTPLIALKGSPAATGDSHMLAPEQPAKTDQDSNFEQHERTG